MIDHSSRKEIIISKCRDLSNHYYFLVKKVIWGIKGNAWPTIAQMIPWWENIYGPQIIWLKKKLIYVS